MTALFEAISLTLTLVFGGVWVCVMLVVRARASSRAQGASSHGARSARAWLFAPVWATLLVLGGALSTDLGGCLIHSATHCIQQSSALIHHLCVLHPTHDSGHGLIIWVLPLLLTACLTLLSARFLPGFLREKKLTATLLATSRPARDHGPRVHLLELPEPLALTVGWLRPRILISTGLIQRVGAETLQVILAHERSHIHRRDNLLAALDRLMAYLWPRQLAAPLLARIALEREQACDAAAADHIGSRARVALALTQVARLQIPRASAGLSIASGPLQARVEHLLNEDPSRGRRLSASPLLLAALFLCGAGPMHALFERLLNLFLHS